MNKSIAAEEITSGVTGEKIRTHDVLTSPNQPALASLAGADLITKNNLIEAIPDPQSSVSGVGLAGDSNPIVVPFTFGTNPKVSVVVPLSTDGTNITLTTRQITLAYDLVFSDNTKTTLVSVLIYGNDDGSGNLNEDTYYSIQG